MATMYNTYTGHDDEIVATFKGELVKDNLGVPRPDFWAIDNHTVELVSASILDVEVNLAKLEEHFPELRDALDEIVHHLDNHNWRHDL